MKLRERDEDLDPRAERELDAIERAFDGREVDPDLAAWAELTTMLIHERPSPDDAWSAELDERATARFERKDSAPGSAGSLLTRLRALPPRRIAAPVGALATLAIVAVVAASTLDGGSSTDNLSSDSGGAVAPTTSGGFEGGGTHSGRTQELDSAGDSASVLPAPSQGESGASAGLAGAAEQGKIAPGTEQRQVDRDVTLTLTTPPEDVRDTADEAIAITRNLDGVVASSQVSRSGQRARASLQLTIPARNLDAALDQLTELANVRTLNEATEDITRPFVSAQNKVKDAKAERAKLLEALGNASTDAEAKALRLQIKDARKTIARNEARFETIARRARLSNVSLTIAGDRAPAATDDGSRTIGGWLDDAASVLRDLVGVLLISAAILVPLAILVALGWLGLTGLRRRRREQALDA